MVKDAIQKCAESNPQILPFAVAQGKDVGFIPDVVDSASTHLGKVSREVKQGRERAFGGKNWDIVNFDSEIADKIDEHELQMASLPQDECRAIQNASRPYLAAAGVQGEIQYIHTMNPFQSKLLSHSEFVEADITYNESCEYPYLFNLVAFDDITMEWPVVSRVCMNKEGAKAYVLAFKRSFQKCQEDYPSFSPGETLVGVVTDWSDAEIQGLGQAVGHETAGRLLRGCKVHWCCSWQRVRDRVANSSDKKREKSIFAKVASQVINLQGSGGVTNAFRVLCGDLPLKALLGTIKGLKQEDAEFVDDKCNWTSASHWANWWTRPAHMKMLHKDFSPMSG